MFGFGDKSFAFRSDMVCHGKIRSLMYPLGIRDMRVT